MKVLQMQYDQRSECLSIQTVMSLKEYTDVAKVPFEQGGNLIGQRDVIKKSSAASKIRKRMNEDFVAGAIFPSVVLGIKTVLDDVNKIKVNWDRFDPHSYHYEDISIIDGMQRSNIYFANLDENMEREIRVEFWVSDRTVKLLYRMLVLNTGQVPWNTRRQIEVIFSSLSKAITDRLFENNTDLKERVDVMSVDDNKRRTQPGKYQKSTMIQLYLGFNTRKVKVDVSDQLADEYQRFDMMDSLDKDINFELFVDAFSYLCRLDFAFSNCCDRSDDGQFIDGKSIFGSVPACLGFIVSCAEFIMGKIPIERGNTEKEAKNLELKEKLDLILTKIDSRKDDCFLALEYLNGVVNQLPKTKIGDEMRGFFKTAFTEMIRCADIDEIPSMESFWRC